MSPDEMKEFPDLEPEYAGLKYEICAMLFKTVGGVSIVVPGEFKSSKNTSCVKCNYKTASGNLFLLKKSLIFINKPVLYIPISEIKSAEF